MKGGEGMGTGDDFFRVNVSILDFQAHPPFQN